MILKDDQGRFLTLALFKELNTSKYESSYTLEKKDADLPSAYKIYMSQDTEYEAAIKLVGDYSHWEKLLNCKPFTDYLDGWRREKEAQLKSMALKSLIRLAKGEGRIRPNVVAVKSLINDEHKKEEKVNKTISKDSHNNFFMDINSELDRLDKVVS